MTEIDTLLVANRGEIALRVIRACRRLGLRVVCVHSEADRGAPWLEHADDTLCIGPGPAAKSYLNISAVIAAARLCGAGLIHPGYGFLSESADFADAVAAAGLVLVGPDAAAMRIMGDKVRAKAAMRAAGVPCVPGSDGTLPDDPAVVRALAQATGYPLILKAAGGGGGRGMRVVRAEDELDAARMLTAQEARRFFGDPRIYMEKFLETPRHVEIQIIADRHGKALWLGDRDCSLQRRHQKVIEEGPAPGIDRALIADIGARCAASCLQIGYVGVGTFEFLYQDGQFHFIEMNTRIQVEHPVTEMVTGLDIVALQIEVALGRPLTLAQHDIRCDGHAIECRINAENPDTMTPSAGTIHALHLPGGPGIRVDSHARVGACIPPLYDSLIGKVIAHGTSRAEALARARAAIDELQIEGVSTNRSLHLRLLSDPGFAVGGVDIHHLERSVETGARHG